MKNALLLFPLIFLSTLLFGQNQITIPHEYQQVQQHVAVTSSLPDQIKGEIPENFPAEQMAEMLMLNRVTTIQGELHELFLLRPIVIAEAISLDEAKYELFKNYLTATKPFDKVFYEKALLDLYL